MKNSIVIAILVLAALAFLIYYPNIQTGPGISGRAEVSGHAEGHGHQAGGHGPMRHMMCGDEPPGHYINELFENHDKFDASYQILPDERKLVWRIKLKPGADPELLDLLKEHIEQMKCILESGGSPRAHDPAFQAEAKLSKYIHTEVRLEGNVLIVEKWADNDCAFDVIKGHAEIVKGFFERGREEAMRTHEFGSPNCADYGFP